MKVYKERRCSWLYSVAVLAGVASQGKWVGYWLGRRFLRGVKATTPLTPSHFNMNLRPALLASLWL